MLLQFFSYAANADSAANAVAVVADDVLYMHMLQVLFTCAVAVVANAVYAYVASVVHMFCCCSC